ncbi:MAG: hypothetical protein WC602_05220 [archaeon]
MQFSVLSGISALFLLAALAILLIMKGGLGQKSKHYNSLTSLFIAAYVFIFLFFASSAFGAMLFADVFESMGIVFLILFAGYEFYIEGIKGRNE